MLEALEAPAGALVVMDRGVATDACVTWLRDNGYRYLVVSRERHRRFDADAAVSLQTQSDQTVHMQKVVSTDPDEVRLYCYSEERANKERGIVERFRLPLRDRPDEAQRRAGPPAGAQAARPGLAAHRTIEGKARPRRLALPGRRHRQRGRRPGRRRHLDPPPPGRLDGYPSGHLLPAQQRDRLGRRRLVAYLHHAHRRRGGIPLAQIRARPAPDLPSQAGAGRRPPVHHRHRLPGSRKWRVGSVCWPRIYGPGV